MNREVEERIVAMYFDNQDFEKNAKTTIDTLGQLKESLNLGKEAEQGFSVFDKISKTLNFDKANQGLTKMKNTMGSMKDLFKKVFNLGPIDNAVRALDNFKNKYFDRVLGFDIAGKLVSNLENAFRSLTIAPVSAGWDQYQAKMDSVKTIMSSTGESMEVVEQHLQSMTEYANKTIYSLTDMTSNLGKFTNNGIKLEEAVHAMEGIANATADAGQGSQQASMAMYNISQAMGVGKMTTIDWKSLENANIATVKLKNTFLDMAAAQGKLRKETRKVGDELQTVYMLETDEEGKKLKKSMEITAENFRDSLSKGWLDKESMLRALMVYSGEGITQDLLESWGIHDKKEQIALFKIGEEAKEAATQVRTFSKMMDALKESVQSGWAESFQIIFGNMEEGTTLWTRINEKFDSVLTRITNRRNTLLKEWADTDEYGNSIWTKDKDNNTVKRAGALGGRDILIESLFELMDVVEDLGTAVSKTFKSVFGELDGRRLLDLTIKFRDLVKQIKDWFGSTNDYDSRISKLMRGLQGVLNIVKVGLRVLKAAGTWIAGKLSPVIDWIIDKFSRLGLYFHNAFGNMSLEKIPAYLGRVIGKIWDKIKAIFVSADGTSDSPFVSWIKKVWGGFKTAVREFSEKLGLSDVLDTISTAWDAVTGWGGWKDIGDFFSNVWGWIKRTFGVVIDWFSPGKDGEESGFVKTMKSLWNAVCDFWNNTILPAGETIWKPIGQFLGDTWAWIQAVFTPEKTTDEKGNEVNGKAPIVQWMEEIWQSVSDFWNNTILPAGDSLWTPIGQFLGNTWGWITNFFGGNGEVEHGYKDGKLQSWYKEPPVVTFLSGIWDSIIQVWNDIKGWEFWGEIGTFLGNTWNWIVNFFTGSGEVESGYKDGKLQSWYKEPPIVTFLSGIWDGIVKAWEDIKGWEFWGEIGTFLGNTWNWITQFFTGNGEVESGYKDGKLQSWYKEPPVVTFLSGVWESVKETWGKISGWGGWEEIGEFFSNIWGWISGLFTGGGQKNSSGTSAEKKVEGEAEKTAPLTEKVVGFFERIIGAIGGFFEQIKDVIVNVPGVQEVSDFLSAAGSFFTGLLKQITIIFRSLGNIFNGKSTMTDWTNLLGVILPIVILKIGQLMNNKYLSNIDATGGQNFAQKFLEIAGGLFLMATAVSIMSTLDQEKLWSAIGAITVCGAIVGVITGIIAKMKATSVQNAAVTSSERILNNLISTVGKVGIIAAALALLPPVIESIGKAKALNNGEGIGQDLLDAMLGLSALIGSITLVMAIAQKLTGNVGLDPVATLKTIVSVAEVIAVSSAVMLAVGGIGEAVDGVFGAGSHEKVLGAMEKAAEFFQSFGNVIYSFFAGLLGYKSDIAKTEEALSQFDLIAEAADKFDQDKINSVARLATLLSTLTSGNLEIDTWKLTNFAEAMGKFGAGIYEYARYLNLEDLDNILSNMADPDSDTYQKLVTFTDFGRQLGDMLTAFNGIDINNVQNQLDKLASEEGIAKFVNNMNVIITHLKDLYHPDEGIDFDGLTIATDLVNALEQGLLDPHLPKIDATILINHILDAIKLGDTGIAQAVHDMVQRGIDASGTSEGAGEYQFSGAQKNVVSQLLGAAGEGNNLLDLSTFKDTLYGKDGKSGILGEINSFGDQIPSLGSMFEGKGWMDFKDDEGKPIDLLGSMQDELTRLGETLANMDPLTVQITPVFDWSNLTVDNMQAELNQQPLSLSAGVENGVITIDFTGLDSALNLEAIRTRLDNVVAAIATYGGNAATAVSGLADHMDGIANEVARLKLYLDTGALVGEITPSIDRELGKRSLIVERTGT